jgi:hypothetical protein
MQEIALLESHTRFRIYRIAKLMRGSVFVAYAAFLTLAAAGDIAGKASGRPTLE